MRYNLVLDRRDIFEVDFAPGDTSVLLWLKAWFHCCRFYGIDFGRYPWPVGAGRLGVKRESAGAAVEPAELIKGLKRMFAVRALMEL